jgi:hypothetical protein
MTRQAAPGLVISHVKVSDEYAAAVLESAIGHMAYWAEVVDVRRDEGGKISHVTVTDLEHDGGRARRTVTRGAVKRAIGLIIREGASIGAGGMIRRQVLEEEPDGPRCDAVFQVALFAEVRYS